jgi:peroxiredoxin (alkyl hydroperoxide reductase subunit C)
MDMTKEEATEETARLPRLNEPAPQFVAPSTHGEVRLEDYKGKWVVLFSHPADFTPVCTTEFIGFAKMAGEFEQLNTKLIGLSIDSVYSHIAWVRNMEAHFGLKIPFPIIADLSMEVATKYGMIHPGASSTAAVRCVFVIDPEQTVRAMMYYPLSTGRLVAEVKRLVQALQVNAKHGLATPEGWQPGDQCIVPAPATVDAAEQRMHETKYELTDWYLARTSAGKR